MTRLCPSLPTDPSDTSTSRVAAGLRTRRAPDVLKKTLISNTQSKPLREATPPAGCATIASDSSRRRPPVVEPPPHQGWEQLWRRGVSYGGDPQPQVVDLAKQLKASGRSRTLDLGCGAGRHLLWLAREGFTVCGCDVSPTAVAACQRALAASRLPGSVLRAEMTALPFRAAVFDAAIAWDVIFHSTVKGILATVDGVRHSLRDGRLSSSPSTPPNRPTAGGPATHLPSAKRKSWSRRPTSSPATRSTKRCRTTTPRSPRSARACCPASRSCRCRSTPTSLKTRLERSAGTSSGGSWRARTSSRPGAKGGPPTPKTALEPEGPDRLPAPQALLNLATHHCNRSRGPPNRQWTRYLLFAASSGWFLFRRAKLRRRFTCRPVARSSCTSRRRAAVYE